VLIAADVRTNLAQLGCGMDLGKAPGENYSDSNQTVLELGPRLVIRRRPVRCVITERVRDPDCPVKARDP
jgi:hypothetical protein